MNEYLYFWSLLILEFIAIPFVAIFLFKSSAAYGRYQNATFGINNRLGWCLMELPAIVIFGISYFAGPRSFHLTPFVFFLMWQTHYINRVFLYPFKLSNNKTLPIAIVFLGMGYNVLNGYLNGRYFTEMGPIYTVSWLYDPRFILGFLLFFSGMLLNNYSDKELLKLRKDEEGYRIPQGKLFYLISCPNYLGEIMEWFGWAIATWSLPGLAFAMFTAANLIPRAISHHEWYRKHFPDYPMKRKAILPFIF